MSTVGDDAKYGAVTLERGQLHDGEPVFVLRAQDPLAAAAIIYYADLCTGAGCHPEHVQMALAAADHIDAWQNDHPELVKDKPGPTGRLA